MFLLRFAHKIADGLDVMSLMKVLKMKAHSQISKICQAKVIVETLEAFFQSDRESLDSDLVPKETKRGGQTLRFSQDWIQVITKTMKT